LVSTQKSFAIYLMKRRSVNGNEMLREKQHLLHEYVTPDDPELLRAIANNINLAFALKKRRDPTVVVYYPEKRLLKLTSDVTPQISVEKVWDGTVGVFEDHLVLEWEFFDLGAVSKILGECFQPRIYPDSQGIVDFKNLRGGKFFVEVSQSKPVTLKYKSYTGSLSISFFLFSI